MSRSTLISSLVLLLFMLQIFNVRAEAPIYQSNHIIVLTLSGSAEQIKQQLIQAKIINEDLDWLVSDQQLVAFSNSPVKNDFAARIGLLMALTNKAAIRGSKLHYLYQQAEVQTAYLALLDPSQQQWLLSRPLLLKINRTLYARSGLSHRLPQGNLAEINLAYQQQLQSTAVFSGTEIEKRQFNPVNYLGSTLCHAFIERPNFELALAQLDANRLIVGAQLSISRFSKRLLTLAPHPQHYIEIKHQQATLKSVQQGPVNWLEIDTISPPYAQWFSEAQLRDYLVNATITEQHPLGTGVTNPLKVSLLVNNTTQHALFKTINTTPLIATKVWRREYETSDQYQYEIAAYLLNQQLGLDMIPATTYRRINNHPGSIQFWLADSVSDLRRQDDNIPFKGVCSSRGQYDLMHIFDGLIGNRDRNLGNVLHDRASWRLWMIDHSRAFSAKSRISDKTKLAAATMPPELATKLSELNRHSLEKLIGDYLNKKQISAILKRRDRLLSLYRPPD